MKAIVISVSVFLMSFAIISCGSEKEEQTSNETAPLSNEDVSAEIDELKKLNNDLLNASPQNTFSAGKQLYHAANEFAIAHPHHEKTPAVLELSAKAAESMQQFQESVNILDKLITEFPETEETPNYMMNKARIIEEKLQDIAKAKDAYNDLIKRFPENQMAIDAKLYVQNFLGKSAEEINQMLDSLNVGQ
jgi:TolA-binding protein